MGRGVIVCHPDTGVTAMFIRVLIMFCTLVLAAFCWAMVLMGLYKQYGFMSMFALIVIPHVCSRIIKALDAINRKANATRRTF